MIPPDHSPESAAEAASLSEAQQKQSDAPKITVLVVEKKATLFQFISEVLLGVGMNVHRAHDLPGAVFAIVAAGPFDAVVCGREADDADPGFLAQWMREQGLNIPLLIVSGSNRPPGKRLTTLRTPFLSTQLVEKMARILPDAGTVFNEP